MNTDIILVFVTCPDTSVAEHIATQLLERKLVACVNILPTITSIYRWQNAVQKDQESLLLIKTQNQRFAELQAAILALHPYDLPEVIALPVEQGLPDYLDWVKTCTTI